MGRLDKYSDDSKHHHKTTTETRYFISSLPVGVKEIARAIRGHWMVESYHWHLDVTFREDDNRTVDKQAAYNLNVLRKHADAVGHMCKKSEHET